MITLECLLEFETKEDKDIRAIKQNRDISKKKWNRD